MPASGFGEATRLATSAIPVIDVSTILNGSDDSAVSKKIQRAATEVGFFYVSGHGIAPNLINQAFGAARDFFALPDTAKQTVAVDQSQRGWMATGMSKLDGAATHDLKEVFFWGTDTASDDPDLLAGKPLIAQNKWPTQAFPRLEADLLPYYAALCDVAKRVMSAIALSLGAPADFFESHYQKPLARGQLVYYPSATTQDEAESRFGVAPHTDFGVLTFLLQDQSGGLQVQLKSGEWVEAPPIPETLVCNIGDLLQRWTNDRFTSTVHRVVNRSGNARYSIPVFFDPHSDAIIDPADLGVPRSNCRYDPIAAGTHIAGRNSKSFAQHKRS